MKKNYHSRKSISEINATPVLYAIYIYDAASNQIERRGRQARNFLDSPSSTSQLTYKVQAISRYSPREWSYNKSYDTGDSFANGQGVSTLTVLEVKG